ncbi:MAG: hypothetical protein Q9226_001966 [Calogaya cf. arnoldii]
MIGKECLRSRVQPVARCFHQQTNVLHLPPVLPQPLPERYGYSEPFGQQHDTIKTQSHFVHLPPILHQPLPAKKSGYSKPFGQQQDIIKTQSQSLTGTSSSPKPRAKHDLDDLEKQFEREYYVHENITGRQEETETDVVGLGIYIPDNRPHCPAVDTQPQRSQVDSQSERPNVVDTLPSPLPASWYDPRGSSRVAYESVVHPKNEAGHAHQPFEHLMGQVMAPLLEWQTKAATSLHRPHPSPRYEMNNLDLPRNSGFPNGGPSQDLHQTTFEVPRWPGHTHMSYQELLASDMFGKNENPMDKDLFNDDI